MSEVLTFIVLGFATGAVYVGISTGLMSVYFSSGILNFAQAATAMWGAYVFASLRNTGLYVLPVGSIATGSSMGTVPAFLLGLASSVALGLVVHFVVFRPLRRSSTLAQIVASVAVLIALVGLVDVRFGTSTIQVTPFLPQTTVLVLGAKLQVGDLILLGLAIVSAAAVGAYFRWTTAGIATRASADNSDALGLMGYSPNWLDAAATTIAAVLSTAMLVFVSPVTSLNSSIAYLVVPALAVVLIAKLRSLTVIAVAGLALGVAQSLLVLGGSQTWWPRWGQSGLSQALPFVVALVVLYAMGDRIGVREETSRSALPRLRLPRRPVATLAIVAAVSLAALLATSGPTRFGVITSIIMVVLVLSYTVITGYLGQLSLAQIAFAGAAGFLLSKLTTSWGIEFPLSVLIAGLFATAVGVIIGVVALRFQGVQLAIVTLAAAVAVQDFIFNNAYFTSINGNPIGEPRLFGVNLAVEAGHNVARIQYGILAVAVLLICVAGLQRWATGRTGRAWLAVRSNERAAASVGVNVTATRVTGFAVSAFLAGVAGCLIGYSQGQLATGSFEVDTGILVFAMAFLGGITSVGGAMVAGAVAPLGIVFILLNDHIAFGNYYTLVAGLGLILTVLMNPDGIAGKLGSQLQPLVERVMGSGARGVRFPDRQRDVPGPAEAFAAADAQGPPAAVSESQRTTSGA